MGYAITHLLGAPQGSWCLAASYRAGVPKSSYYKGFMSKVEIHEVTSVYRNSSFKYSPTSFLGA